MEIPILRRNKVDSFWITIEQIRETLDYSVSDFSDTFKMTSSRYRYARERRRPISMENFDFFLDYFNLSIYRVLSGDIDYSTLNDYLSVSSLKVPDRYLSCARSKNFVPFKLLKEVETAFGREVKSEALKYLQINSDYFDSCDMNDHINITAPVDIVKFLELDGCFPADIYNIGKFYIRDSLNVTRISKLLERLTIKNIYEAYVYEHVSLIEKNCKYEISKAKDDTIVLRVLPEQEILNNLSLNCFGNSMSCQLKLGVATTPTTYFGLPSGDAQESKCIHRGNRYCEYIINFENAYRDLKRGRYHAAVMDS